MSESYWKLPDVENVRTPFRILREQAKALTEATGGRLEGVVENRGERTGDRVLVLSIRVPSLDDYSYRLLEYRHPLELYPGEFSGIGFGIGPVTISSESDFIRRLKDALSSQGAQHVIQALLAQADDFAV